MKKLVLLSSLFSVAIILVALISVSNPVQAQEKATGLIPGPAYNNVLKHCPISTTAMYTKCYSGGYSPCMATYCPF